MRNFLNLDFSLPSAQLDQQLGLEASAIEKQLYLKARERLPEGTHHDLGELLHNGNQSWVGLGAPTLLTPYSELQMMCEKLRPAPGETVVDLGAGYGRLGIVLGHLYPETNFLGYEVVKERVDEGERIFKKHGHSRARLIEQDLTCGSFKPPDVEYYFIYDYGKVGHIRRTLEQLSEIADRRKFKVIGRGKGTRSLIDNEFLWLISKYQDKHFTIYSM